VEDGEVVNDFEYREMHDLSEAAAELAETNGDPELIATIEKLREAIRTRESLPAVRKLTLEARSEAIDAYGITLAPGGAPDFDNGKRSYASNCASCHGADGTAGVPGTEEMEPQPVDFTDPQRRANLSPYRAHNTTTFGVEGTAMTPFAHLSDAERWDLAFYVMALAHGARNEPGTMPETLPELPLTELARLKDYELREELTDRGVDDVDAALGAMRTAAPYRAYESASTSDSLATAREHLDAAESAAHDEKWSEARQSVLASYLEGFEPVESQLNSIDGQLTRDVEASYLNLRDAIKKQDGAQVDEQLQNVRARLDEADELLASDTTSFALASAAAFIALREGVEVVLLLALLLGVVRRLGEDRARRYVHGGWIAAVVAGVATWFAASTLIDVSGAGRELLEGIVALLAAVVLFSVSYWFIGKVQGEAWTGFIKSKLANKIEGGQLISIAGVSFLAVYREAFETVLFYQALVIEAEGNLVPIFGGIAVAVVLLAAFALAIFKLGAKLPLKQFFTLSAIGLYLLCVILAGNGLHALVEAGVYEPVLVSSAPTIELLGVYPDAISLSLQAALVVAAAVWFVRTRLTEPSKA
jgi:high-affinity iron transporter